VHGVPVTLLHRKSATLPERAMAVQAVLLQ